MSTRKEQPYDNRQNWIDKGLVFNGSFNTAQPATNEEIKEVYKYFDTQAEAEEFAANFPKYCKAEVASMGSMNEWSVWFCGFRTAIKTDDRTGHANETAAKRSAKIFEILRERGLLAVA